MQTMFTIVALGNPGEEYANTRHNAGRIALLKALPLLHLAINERAALSGGPVAEGVVAEQRVRVFFPPTYMNESGAALSRLQPLCEPARTVIVYDDVDIPLGELKISFDRGHGGHNGVMSVIQHLGSREFHRVRVGIAPRNWWGKTVRPTGEKLPAYVLGVLSKRERDSVEKTAASIAAAIEDTIKKCSGSSR